jgi:hypothetical protein
MVSEQIPRRIPARKAGKQDCGLLLCDTPLFYRAPECLGNAIRSKRAGLPAGFSAGRTENELSIIILQTKIIYRGSAE